MSSSNKRRRFPRPNRRQRFVFYGVGIAVCLVINIWAANEATRINRNHVPYSPFFLEQIRDGNVEAITSKGTAIQGRLRQEVEAPSVGSGSKNFATEIPSFANTEQLDTLLERNDVSVNAEPLQTSGPWWERLLLGVVPTLLLLLLLYWLFRRMTGGSPTGAFGRSRAKRYEPSASPTT